MRKIEQKFWDRLKTNLGSLLYLERIENLVGAGIPDLLVCWQGVVVFAELKAIECMPARRTSKVLGSKGLSVDQKNWHRDWNKHGGTSVVLISVGSKNRRDIYAVRGSMGDQVNDMTVEEMESFKVRDWDHLAMILRGHDALYL